MRLLILGGTVFLGRHLTEAALERGHAVTLFNRGQSAPDAFPGLEQVHGDREHDLGLLGDREWDAVIDTSGYVPRIVREAATRLRAGHYTFVSSISVYGTFERVGLTEDDPPAALPEPGSEDVERFYGELKALCEDEVRGAVAERALIVRSGLLVGPHDPTERFTYWVRRLADGGEALAPAAPDQPVQVIDARDMAQWILQMAEAARGGTFNATGPAQPLTLGATPPPPLTLGATLELIRAGTGGRARLAWRDEADLAGAGVEPWSDLPLWLDLPRHPELRGFMATDVSRALAAGITFRPLEQTIADTLAWVRSRTGPGTRGSGVPLPPAGLDAEREYELLARLPAPG